jgi:hypothetical protein
MNTEYIWWVVVLLLVAGGAIAFLALGQVPEIEDEPEPASETGPAATWTDSAPDQGAPVRSSVPGSGDPSSTSDTP